MGKNEKISFANFIIWISNAYKSLERRAIPYPCKLTGIKLKAGITYLEIQYSGLTDNIELDINKVVEQNIFEYFSPADKKKIFYYLYNYNFLSMTDSFKCPETGKDLVVLTECITKNKMTLEASCISKDRSLLDKIDSNSACRIGGISESRIFKDILASIVANYEK